MARAIFAAQDDPTPNMLGFLVAAAIALVIDAVYLFAVLPRANSFEMFVIAFAPMYLLLGAMMSMPATFRIGGPIAFIAATQLALPGSYAADFPSYVNSSAAAIAGLGATVIITRIIRPVSAEWTAYRLLRRNRRAIKTIAANRSPANLAAFVTLMLDRLSLVAPRLAVSTEGDEGAAASALADLRVGINILGLQRDASELPEGLHCAIRTMLDAIAAHYWRRSLDPADNTLLGMIDRVIAEVVQDPAGITRALLLQLSAIRRGLYPDAPPYTSDMAREMMQQTIGRRA